MPRYEVIQDISKADHRRIILTYFQSSNTWSSLLVLLIGLALLAYLFLEMEQDELFSPFIAGFLTACFFLYFLMVWTIYSRGLKQLADIDYQARLILDDDYLTQTSSMVTAIFPWTSVCLVRRTPQCWLIFLSRGDFFGIPVRHLTPEMKTFLTDKVRQAGGKVL